MKKQTVAHTIEKTRWFPHSIDKVWKAITEQENVSAWLAPTNFRAEIGFNYQIDSKEEGCNPIFGTVKKAAPYTLIYTWKEKTHQSVETEVRWDLTSHDDGTLVQLTHSGIENYEGDVGIKMYESFSGGWKHCLEQIENLLNQ